MPIGRCRGSTLQVHKDDDSHGRTGLSHVLEAAGIWDTRHAHGGSDHPFFKHNFRNSNHFDVLIGGRPYPPKAIASCAHGLATGQYLPTSEFAGAKDGLWHRRFKALGFQVVEKKLRDPVHALRGSGPAKSIEKDINDILSSTHLPATKRKALIEARIGQGRFRRGVLKRWNQGCAVTGCTALEALRASHIKPWRMRRSGATGPRERIATHCNARCPV
ncbi:hypothetical protein JLDANKMP_00569 [Stenotrophomonas sp. PE591]|nr:hypothetical protein [Stenotrophomonas sp. PE591]